MYLLHKIPLLPAYDSMFSLDCFIGQFAPEDELKYNKEVLLLFWFFNV